VPFVVKRPRWAGGGDGVLVWPLRLPGRHSGFPRYLLLPGVRNWIVLTAGAAAAAIASGVSQVARARWSHARLRRDDQLTALAEGWLANADGTLKTVRHATDPVGLGVHEATGVGRPHDEDAAGRVPAYILRESTKSYGSACRLRDSCW
jgi:hypothetical protein